MTMVVVVVSKEEDDGVDDGGRRRRRREDEDDNKQDPADKLLKRDIRNSSLVSRVFDDSINYRFRLTFGFRFKREVLR